MTNTHEYDDIIDLPHHISPTRARMPRTDRAAQFAPFAALTGHEAAIEETARLTERCMQLDEEAKALINEKLLMLLETAEQHPTVTVTYFRPDAKKEGGAYCSITDAVKRVASYEKQLELANGTVIPIERIVSLDGKVFQGYW